MRRRKRRQLLIFISYFLFMTISLSLMYFYFGVYKFQQLEKDYQSKISEFDRNTFQDAFILKKDIDEGQKVDESLLSKIKLPKKLANNELVISMGEIKSAKFSRKIKKGSILYKDMIFGLDALADDIRNIEISNIRLPQKAEIGDYFDLRIVFPKGEDFVVISKIRLENLFFENDEIKDKKIASFYLNNSEILLLSAALKQSHDIKGSEIYASKYIYPSKQKASKITYYPNSEIIKDIEKTIAKASKELSKNFDDEVETKEVDEKKTEESYEKEEQIEEKSEEKILDENTSENTIKNDDTEIEKKESKLLSSIVNSLKKQNKNKISEKNKATENKDDSSEKLEENNKEENSENTENEKKFENVILKSNSSGKEIKTNEKFD